MKYFNRAKTLKEAKELFRDLIKKNHPDCGGDTKIMAEINAEWEIISYSLKDLLPKSETFYREFYTDNGYKGKNYSVYRSTKEITFLIRQYVKEVYNDCRFSVTFESYSGGSSICVRLKEAPFEVMKDGSRPDSYNVNQYYIDDDELLTPEALAMFKDINSFIKSYHMDDSDSMIDYFHTNFYYSLSIGNWDKEFTVVPRKRKPLKFIKLVD